MIIYDFNKKELDELVDEGLLQVSKHPELDLYIYNYTHIVQFKSLWTPLLEACRGLIINEEGEVVGRPFPKFFNYEEIKDLQLDYPVEITEKMDGSLIICCWYGDNFIVSSRKSFVSKHTDWAKEIINNKPEVIDCCKKGWTTLFELIHPENRIVVDYGNEKDLYLITTIANSTGFEVCNFELPKYNPTVSCKIVSSIDNFLNMDIENKEGFVIREIASTNRRIKIKFETYKKLHKLYSDLTVKNILYFYWKSKNDINQLISDVPDEYYQWIKDVISKIEDTYNEVYFQALIKYTEILERIRNDYEELKNLENRKFIELVKTKYRKVYAEHVFSETFPHFILFGLLDYLDCRDLIYKHLWNEFNLYFSNETFRNDNNIKNDRKNLN